MPQPPQPPRIDRARPPAREIVWDEFVDALDRQGQAGTAAEVMTPTTLHPEAPSGKRFGDLTKVEVDNLAKIAESLGRRGDVVKSMWKHTQRQLKDLKRAKT